MHAALGSRALRSVLFSAVLLSASAVMVVPGGTQASPGPDLGTADPFVILTATGITDSPTSTITGDIGVQPSTGASITGITCAQVTGTIYTNDGAGPAGACAVTDAALLVTAKADLDAARVDAAGRIPDDAATPVELGGTTKFPGVYTNAGSNTFGITAGAGPLTLDAQGDPDAVFIFQAPDDQASSLTVGPGSEVILTGGAQACNVWWSVNGATIDDGAIFKGNILAATSVTVNAGADIEGRLMGSTGNVTLIDDTISRADCTVVPPGPPPGPPGPPFLITPPNFTG